MQWSRRMVISSIVACLLAPARGQAQWAVIDASNLAQTTLTAFNTARGLVQQGVQIAHEVELIKNQLEQLAYDAANLTALPLQIVDDLISAMNSYEALLRQAEGLKYQYETITSAFENLYPRIGSGYTPRSITGKVKQMLFQIRAGAQGAMQAQAILERITDQKQRVQRLVVASDAAPGLLAAQQANNNLMAVIAEQNVSLQQLHAASYRAQASVAAAQAIEADAAQSLADAWLQHYGRMAPVEGVGIPEFR
jgi:type IV secretion system protein TrbJ